MTRQSARPNSRCGRPRLPGGTPGAGGRRRPGARGSGRPFRDGAPVGYPARPMSGLWKRLRAIAVPPEERPGRRRALRLAGLAVVLAFAALAAAKVDVRGVLAALVRAHPGLLALAMLAGVVNL